MTKFAKHLKALNQRQEDYLRQSLDLYQDEYPVTLTFNIPFPPHSLSPNGRLTAQQKGRDVADYREMTVILARNALAAAGHKKFSRLVIHYKWVFTGACPEWEQFGVKKPIKGEYKPRDKDNARYAMKPVQDGIADAVVSSMSDSYDICESGYVAFVKEERRSKVKGPFPVYNHVEVTIQGTYEPLQKHEGEVPVAAGGVILDRRVRKTRGKRDWNSPRSLAASIRDRKDSS